MIQILSVNKLGTKEFPVIGIKHKKHLLTSKADLMHRNYTLYLQILFAVCQHILKM